MQPVLLLLAILAPAIAMKMADFSAPSVGDTIGPIVKQLGELLTDELHLYHDTGHGDQMINEIQLAGKFRNRDDMLAYVKSQMDDDLVIVQVKPEKLQKLQGKQLEVLTSKPLPGDATKMLCHSYLSKPALCHLVTPGNIYSLSLVRDVETGDVFPTVFSSHRGWHSVEDLMADKDRNVIVSHINELAVIKKEFV